MKIDSAPPSVISRSADSDPSPGEDERLHAGADTARLTDSRDLPDASMAGERLPLARRNQLKPTPFSPRARVTVLAVGAFAGFLFLLQITTILNPFLWAIVVAYILNPVVRFLCRRTAMPRTAAVILIFVIGVGSIVGLLSVAVPRLDEQVTQLANDLPSLASQYQARYFGSSSHSLVIGGISIDVPQVTRQLANSLNSALNNFFGGAFSAVVSSIERLAQFLLFVIVTFYLLLDAPQIAAYLRRLVPPAHRDEVLDVAQRVNAVLSQYMRAQLILIAIMSTASFIVLSIMGVRFAIVLAPLAGILEIFPIIGPFAAISVVTLLALFSPPHYGLSHTSSALIIAVVFFIMRQIEDYAVIPSIVGHAVRLHPALVLFAVAAGATFGGALGLFLAVPVTGALKVLGSYMYKKLVPEWQDPDRAES
jgi:predicted PurR-regulated permease PerM